MAAVQTPKTKDGMTVHWALYKPYSEAPSKCPVVLFLHGCGERGSDMEHLEDVNRFLRNVQQPCFIVAPQCPWAPKTDKMKPEGNLWVDVDWRLASHKIPTKASVPLTLAMDMVDEVVRTEEQADATRVHVCGLSMGGFGAWDALSRWPERFASALIMCAGADQDALNKVGCALPPVWAFHGDLDKVVQPHRSSNAIDCMRVAGVAESLARLTRYQSLGHCCWDQTFDNPVVAAWLLSFQRPNLRLPSEPRHVFTEGVEYFLISKGHAAFLDTHGPSSASTKVWNGGKTSDEVIALNRSGAPGFGNLRWRLDPVPGLEDTCFIVNAAHSAFLDTHGDGVAVWNGGFAVDDIKRFNLSGALGAGNLQWRLDPVPGEAETYFIINVGHGKFLDTHGPRQENRVWVWNGGKTIDQVKDFNCSGAPGADNLKWIKVKVVD